MKKLSAGKLSIFCEQFGMLLEAGMSAQESIGIMKEELKNEEDRQLLENIQGHLNEGVVIYDAFKKSEAFPEYMIEMVSLGFKVGKLDEVVGNLGNYYKRQENIQQAIKRVMFYPLILLGLMSTVILIMSTKVMPIFENILNNLGMQISHTAVGMIKVGALFSQVSIGLLLLVATSVVVLIAASKFEQVKSVLVNKSKLAEELDMCKFLSALALMVESGTDMVYAIRLSMELIEHQAVRNKLQMLLEDIEGHRKSIVDALTEQNMVSSIDSKMLHIAQRTGKLEEVLKKVAMEHEEKVQLRLEQILGRIEPTIIIILGITIGSILLSVMIPLLSIMSTIG